MRATLRDPKAISSSSSGRLPRRSVSLLSLGLQVRHCICRLSVCLMMRSQGNLFVSAERLRELFVLHVTVRHRFFDDFIIKSLRE